MRPRLSRTSALFTSAAPRWLALVLITWNTAPAFAQSCKDDGGLAYLGNTRDASRSVWLSGTVAGSFSLEAAQGNTTVDTWSRETRGLHISTSPFVSSGSGGTHRLFNTSGNNGCLIDTQNQKRDFVLPNIRPPSGVLPPIGGFFPDFGGLMPSRPGLGQINLPQLPGSGPTGVMPGLPVGVQPPIGTLPPTGVMPSRPGLGQINLPRLPGSGPTGVMPGLPVGVQPPIGTLPPTGVMPSRPTMPNLPGGVQPPIGTLPPDRVAASDARLRVARPDEYCIDPRAPRTTAEGEEINLPVCPPDRLAQAGAQGVAPASQVPLTEGRDLGAPTLWNVWAEGSVLGISDERFGLDMETTVGTGTFGIDRRLSDDVVLGVSFSVQNSSTEGFGDFLQVDANGFTVGPYVAVRLSPHWAMDASLTYGHYDNDIELAILGGDYTSRTYGGTVNLHGQYSVGEYLVRPKASVSYTHIDNDGYDLEGSIFGFPIDLVSRRQLQLRRFRSHD